MIIDSLRYDCIGYQQNKKYLDKENVAHFLDTPTLDRLSKESEFFTKCYSTSSQTLTVLSSIFTGTTENNHYIRGNRVPLKLKLNQKISTLAEILKGLGYLTICAIDKSTWWGKHDLFRGFDFVFFGKSKELFQFLNSHKNEKIFLFSLFEDVHNPYLWSNLPPNENYNDDFFKIMKPLMKQHNLSIPENVVDYWYNLFAVNDSRELWLPIYVKGVTKFDKGRFKIFVDDLEKINFLDKEKSLLIITADHGEGKHDPNSPNRFSHGKFAYEENARVPLIIRVPGLKHEIRNELVSNIDIFKIIIDFCTDNKSENFVNHKLHCINPFYEKRKYAWYVNSEFLRDGSGLYYFPYRVIITSKKKYSLKGNPVTFLVPSFFKLEDREFIQKLYLGLLARPGNNTEIEFCKKKLQSVSKHALYEEFLKSDEYIGDRKKCFVFDLEKDPFEENPLNPFDSVSLSKEYLENFKHILDLEGPNIKNENEFSPMTDEEIKEQQKVMLELRKLGYM